MPSLLECACCYRYRTWWWMTILAVGITVLYEPWVIAFAEYPGLGCVCGVAFRPFPTRACWKRRPMLLISGIQTG